MSFYTDPKYTGHGDSFRAGYVSIVGRPNVGKSTLLNRLIEQKISIVTRKPQTTRWQIRGIKSTPDYQIVFSDTPGYQNTYKSAINRYMNREVVNSLAHLDLVLFVVEAVKWYREDDFVADLLKDVSAPVVLVINKLDLAQGPYLAAAVYQCHAGKTVIHGNHPAQRKTPARCRCAGA